jgi:membrane-associated phospholipid phosphatase
MKKLSRSLVQFGKRQISPKLSSLLSVLWMGGLAISGLALWGFAEIAEEVFEQETKAIDTSILQTFQTFHTPLIDQIAIAVTFLGEPFVLIILSCTLAFISLWQRKWAEASVFAIVVAGGISLNFWLKTLFARARPALWEHIVDVRNYSFPSGHAMVSLIVYGFIGYWLIIRYPSAQKPILTATVLLVVAIGLSRLYLGVHWPTDVVAGYAAGLVWLFICILILEVLSKEPSTDDY